MKPHSQTPYSPVCIGLSALLAFFIACANGHSGRTDGPGNSQAGNSTGHAQGEVQSASILVGTLEREFSLFVPGLSVEGKLPIVIYLHGHGDNMRHILGRGRMPSASSQWMDVAQREGFLVLYPLGLKGPGRRGKTGWNDCRTDAEGDPASDDVAFIRQMIDFAIREKNGDRTRVYVTGMSNGGHMTMRVAMELSDVVAAAAPIAALMPTSISCSPPARPVPILMMHGTDDPLAPYAGGAMAGNRGEVLSARETAATWIQWNQLTGVPETSFELPDLDDSDNSSIVARAREESPSGNAVIAFEMRGAGHTEPSKIAKLGRLLRRIQGNQNRDIEMAEVVWDFFKSRSR